MNEPVISASTPSQQDRPLINININIKGGRLINPVFNFDICTPTRKLKRSNRDEHENDDHRKDKRRRVSKRATETLL